MTHLTILHTNDLHGRIHKLPRIAALARQIRQEVQPTGGFCALWDAGDAEDPVLFESRMTKGSAMMAVLRLTGYDQAALGNATPIRYGPQAVQSLAEAFGKPLLCANLIDSRSGQLVPGLTPFVIEAFGPLKAGIIGMTAFLQGYSFFNVDLPDLVSLLPVTIDRVRSLGARTVILLSHMGSVVDQQVAGQVAGLDVIIGGHDHVAFDPPLVVNRALVAQAGEYGQHLGRLDLEIDPSTGKVIHHRGCLVPVDDDGPVDDNLQLGILRERERVEQLIQREIGVLAGSMDWAEDRQCAAGNFLADVLLDRFPGVQIALALAGHWNSGLERGPLSIGRLYDSVRSTANPARTELTGAQILHFLREALKPENISRRPRPLRGVAVGMPHVAGMHVQVDNAAGGTITAWIGAEPVQFDRKYSVATTDLELSRDVIGYLDLPDSQVALEVPTIVPEILEQYISRASPLIAPTGSRIAFLQS